MASKMNAIKGWAGAGLGAAAAVLLAACGTVSDRQLPPLTLASPVDIERFMGDWYVIANIPTFLEEGAHAARENYQLQSDGSVLTTFSFNADSFNGPLKTYQSRGFVEAGNEAIWGMQYVWPFKADYRIAYLAPDGGHTVIARDKRDYVWIMARTPAIPEADYQRLSAFIAAQGYDVAKLRKVPQRATP